MLLAALGAATVLLQGTSSALAPSSAKPLTPFARKKAETLLRDKLPCLGCHELRGDGGRVGPSFSDLARRRDSAFVLRMLHDPAREIDATIMPRPGLDSATAVLITRYLLARRPTRPAGPLVAVPPPPTGDTSGAGLYRRSCAPCHGRGGGGDGPNAPFLPVRPTPHADAAFMATRPDDVLYDAIAAGGAAMGKSPRMPAFGGSLTPAQIRALVAHLRVLCRCTGPAWSRDGGEPVSRPGVR